MTASEKRARKLKPLPGRWVCNKCTAQNWDRHIVCTACCKGTKAESEMLPKPRQRETAEQRARRIGRGLGFWFVGVRLGGGLGSEFHIHRMEGKRIIFMGVANRHAVALWRALERSQRALARARGVRL